MELFELGYSYQVMLLQVHKCDVYKQLQKVGLYGKSSLVLSLHGFINWYILRTHDYGFPAKEI